MKKNDFYIKTKTVFTTKELFDLLIDYNKNIESYDIIIGGSQFASIDTLYQYISKEGAYILIKTNKKQFDLYIDSYRKKDIESCFNLNGKSKWDIIKNNILKKEIIAFKK